MGYLPGQTALPDRSDASPSSSTPFLQPFAEGWVLYYPLVDKLLVLNPTGKMVWELSSQGYRHDEIASAFVQQFCISDQRAWQDVGQLIAEINQASRAGDGDSDATIALPDRNVRRENCGSFRFGKSRIRVFSSVAEADRSLFARFQHRAISDGDGAEILEITRHDGTYRLAFRGSVSEETATGNMLWSIVRLLLKAEHPDTPLLAFCHAAALLRGGRSLLMPGRSGVGKSTLTAFLVAHGFTYLGDDTIAIGEDDVALLPLPTCLSIKSGSWPVLEQFYPMLRQLPTLNRYGRSVRYVEPEGNYETLHAAAAPAAIVFPAYAAGEPTRLTPLQPLQTMIHLLGAHARLSIPATEAKLAKLLRFVEQTPAYELAYCELASAMQAIEDLLAGPR